MDTLHPALPYRDRKRYLWLISLFIPTLGLLGPALYLLVSTDVLWLWLFAAPLLRTLPPLPRCIISGCGGLAQ